MNNEIIGNIFEASINLLNSFSDAFIELIKDPTVLTVFGVPMVIGTLVQIIRFYK